MSEIQIHQLQSEEEKVLSLARQTDALYEEIGLRAFLRFEARGGLHGYDREDWLEAERSLIFAPPAELVDKEHEFVIRIAAPGFDAGQIHVNVLPRAIILNGDAAKTGGPEETVLLSDFNRGKLLRRVDLPAEVRTNAVRANLEDGIVKITVKKAAVEKGKTGQVVAARA